MKKMYFALMIIGLVLTSCGSGGSPSSRAKDLCDCLKDAGVEFDGINDLDDLEKIGDKMEKKKGQKCVLAVMEGVDDDISDMDDKETGEYLRDFLKAVIDTDCASGLKQTLTYYYDDYGARERLIEQLQHGIMRTTMMIMEQREAERMMLEEEPCESLR